MNGIQLFPRPQNCVILEGFLKQKPVFEADALPEGLASPLRTLWPQAFGAKENVGFCKIDTLAAEQYELAVCAESVTIRYAQKAGALYALMTLRQLSMAYAQIPCCRIEDYPGLRDRAFMLDISRGKIPTVASVKCLIDLLVQFKYNQLQLYIEGFSFEYRSFRAQKQNWEDALTPEDIRELDQYCLERCVQLVPNQNSLGHMYAWLHLPEYTHLAESPEGVKLKNVTLPPTTLDPADPGSLQLVERMMDDLLPCFTSKLFNVDMDEPFELGMGKNKERAQQEGLDVVYLDYVTRLREAVCKRGYKMMMWGDVLSKSERAIEQMAEDIIVLDWGYEAQHPVRRRAERLHAAGREFYLCPGTNTWSSFTGITDNMLQCVSNAVQAAYDFGAQGLMLTDWGDSGHLQYWVFTMPGFVYAACGAWNKALPTREELAWALSRFVFEEPTDVLGELCLKAGEYSRLEEFLFPCRTNAFMTLQRGWTDKAGLESAFKRMVDSMRFFVEPCVYLPCEEEYANRREMNEPKILAFIDALLAELKKARPQCGDGELVCDEIANGLQMVRATTRLRACILGLEDGDGLANEIDSLCEAHERLWMARNRTSGLKESLEGFRAVAQILHERADGQEKMDGKSV